MIFYFNGHKIFLKIGNHFINFPKFFADRPIWGTTDLVGSNWGTLTDRNWDNVLVPVEDEVE